MPTPLKAILLKVERLTGNRQNWLKYSSALSMAGLVVLGACSKQAEKTEDIRPVRAVKVTAGSTELAAEFSGEIRPRVESRLGFRVGGKIVARNVDVGTEVKRGQILMQLDPQDLALAQSQAKAGLSAAESNRNLARDEFKRYQDLREKNFVAATVLDGKENSYRAAQANYEQALAAFKNQSNQAAYANLISDVDGVVTVIEAEAGQVVAAGIPVLRVAQSGAMDVIIGIPEDKVNTIRQIKDIRVRLWANPTEVISAKLRELSPIADPVTRTYVAKLALPDTTKNIKLGMTASVTFVAKTPNAMIKLPMTALFQEKNTSSVWIVEAGAVKLVPVQVSGSSGQDVLLSSGVSVGQTVVTAGVNLLKSGQKVTVLDADPLAGTDKNPAASKVTVTGAAK
ncbi:MAG: efflux RND transporter periplasmic adaptor subunit [Undibacterium sp.]|uniref:efflux RND transporter periplasmic adaptor subunit n=1 Tax=Undibacterium sp. TaxID=1914977 RepID=UPI002725EF6C|nr:efflux RND transporter periplasmic adaptor subunit [Undibacterium sp.]MDO8654266.1 efflux RND transporter periplasmic adaptor subunit [Undibacterium sp.]